MTRDEAIRKAVDEWCEAAEFIIMDRSLDQISAMRALHAEIAEVCEALGIEL